MNKRNLASVLWFLMGWVLGSALAIAVGLPTIVGALLVAFPLAAFIRIGPGNRLWSTAPQTTHSNQPVVRHGPLATE